MTSSSRSPVARLFDVVSRAYDQPALQALVYRPAQNMALDELRAFGARRVLDVGCGTGIFSARIADELGAEVIGVDFSEQMLEQARQRSTAVDWTRGDATRLPIADAGVDAVVCTEAFHWFDQEAALAEFARVVRDGGLLLIAMINPRTEAGSRLLQAQAGRALGAGTWPSRRRMHAMVESAAFGVREQRRVIRLAGTILPTRLTVGVRSPR
jgi:ubiquinone/menaquinone biosynthesis C-methylase UbiE